MNHVTREAVRVRHPVKLRQTQVARVEQLSPRMRRVTFTGPELDGFVSLAADDHVKLFFPAPGQDRPVLPQLGGSGMTYPDGAIRPAVRDYTPRRYDPQRRELVVEFVLHGAGPATAWAAQAAPGQWVGVGGPKGSRLAPEDCDTFLLAGDETALPAIARHLEEMRPGARALVLTEVADAQEERHLPTAANASVAWLSRGGAQPGTSRVLEQALHELSLPSGYFHAWIAAEIGVARRLRQYLIEEEGLARDQIRAAGYWRLGDAGVHANIED